MNLTNEKPVDARSIANRQCLERLLLLIAGTGQDIRVTIGGIRTECEGCLDDDDEETHDDIPYKKYFAIKLEHLYVLGEKLVYMEGLDVDSKEHILIPFSSHCNPVHQPRRSGTMYSTKMIGILGPDIGRLEISPAEYHGETYYPVEHLYLDAKYFRKTDYVIILFDESLLTDCQQVF